MSHNISPCLSDLLHSVWHSLGPSVLLHWPYFILSNGWVILYVPHLLHPVLCPWIFRCFRVLAVVKSAAVNTGMHVCFGIYFPNVCYWLGGILTLEKARHRRAGGLIFRPVWGHWKHSEKIKVCSGLTSISLTFIVQQLVGTGEI